MLFDVGQIADIRGHKSKWRTCVCFDEEDLRGHEADNDFSSTLELQLGKMIRPNFGLYGELLLGDVVFDTDAYDMGFTLAARVLY
jgi:hypothetical protein